VVGLPLDVDRHRGEDAAARRLVCSAGQTRVEIVRGDLAIECQRGMAYNALARRPLRSRSVPRSATFEAIAAGFARFVVRTRDVPVE
jgi:hypothetical protein